jgi:hypothetical protein
MKTQGVKSLNEAPKESAWGPEVKPKLDGHSKDMAVLLHAGGVLGLMLYQFTSNYKIFQQDGAASEPVAPRHIYVAHLV